MYSFEALEDVVSTLDRLAQRQPPLVAMLPRQPGTKESRYMHLFSGSPSPELLAQAVPRPPRAVTTLDSASEERLAGLEEEIASLRKDFSEMRQQLADFRKQFE